MTSQSSAKIEVTLDRETKQLLKQIRDELKKMNYVHKAIVGDNWNPPSAVSLVEGSFKIAKDNWPDGVEPEDLLRPPFTD